MAFVDLLLLNRFKINLLSDMRIDRSEFNTEKTLLKNSLCKFLHLRLCKDFGITLNKNFDDINETNESIVIEEATLLLSGLISK